MKKLNELLGTEFPIIQGGMANIATGEFAAACSNAGALGVIATGGMLEADLLRKQIRICKSLTDKPFGVNLMLMNPCADEMAQIIIEEGVQVVTTGAGSPGKYIPAWKEAGIKVFPVIAATTLVRRLAPLGVDGFIAECRPEFDYFYACGPLPMLRALCDAVPQDGQLSFEERMGCGFGACMGCSCKTKYGNKRICKEGPVLTKGEVIW